MNNKEAFEILGLPTNSSLEDVKKAYRNLAKIHHPDKGGDSNLFKKLTEAYRFITDPSFRFQNSTSENAVVEIPVFIDLEHLIFGVKNTLHVSTQISEQDIDPETRIAFGKTAIISLVDNIPKGKIRPVSFTHKINNALGNVTVLTVYKLKPHPRYKVINDQIIVGEEIDLKTALKGGKITIQTLFGLRTLKIPPGTMVGSIFNIKKHGHLDPLLVEIINIRMPNQDELKTDKWKELAIDWAQANAPSAEDLEEEELLNTYKNLT